MNSSKRKYRILVATDSINTKTGYARVGSHILNALHAAGHEVAQLAWYHAYQPVLRKPWSTFTTFKDHNGCCRRGPAICEKYQGDRIRYIGLDKSNTPVSVDKDGMYCSRGTRVESDRYGHSTINVATAIFRPDIVITVGDQWMCQSADTCQLRDTYIHIMYAAVDGEPLPRYTQRPGHFLDWQELYEKTDISVAYCSWAKDAINEMVGREVVDAVIPFGVDSHVFRHLSAERKRQLRMNDNLGFVSVGRTMGSVIWNAEVPKEDDFNILYAGRNIQRKNIPFIMETVAKFKDRGLESSHRKIKLFFHMPYHDNGWNMDELIRQYNAYDWVRANPRVRPGVGPEDDELNEIYNTADLHLHMSAAEGFSLPALESLSAGVITTSMNYSAPPSWGKDALQLIEPIVIRQEPMTNLGRAYPDIDHAISVLKQVYDMTKEERIALSQKGRALANTLSWHRFAQSWIDLINNMDIANVRRLREEDSNNQV